MIVIYTDKRGREHRTASMTSAYCDLYAKKMEEMGKTNIRKSE